MPGLLALAFAGEESAETRGAVAQFLLTFSASAAVVVGLCGMYWVLFLRRDSRIRGSRWHWQLGFAISVILGVVAVALSVPADKEIRGQFVGLFGLGLTAIIGLSSTTFVSNAMAGLMLRAVKCLRIGDFVRIGNEFGRVTELKVFHTEIQTEDRDLTTLPNMHLVTNPVRVVRTSGTIVSSRLSIGYDEPHGKIAELLIEAASACGLEEPFVQVVELGDFSVTYRIAGFLSEVRHVLSMRSKLNEHVLDSLHGAGVEIVSPTFMNQRRVEEPVIPDRVVPKPEGNSGDPENIIFDKADAAERVAQWKQECVDLEEEIQELKASLKGDASDEERARTERRMEWKRNRVESLSKTIAEAESAS